MTAYRGEPALATLLLRPARRGDVRSAMRLLPGHSMRPGEQLFVLADLALDDAASVRGAAVVRIVSDGWEVPAIGTDTRWPPAGAFLVEQILAAAAAAGARWVCVAQALFEL